MGFFDDALRNVGNFLGINKQPQKQTVAQQKTKKPVIQPQQSVSMRQQVVGRQQPQQTGTGLTAVLPVQQIQSVKEVQQAKKDTVGSQKLFPDADVSGDDFVKAFNGQGKITTKSGNVLDLSNAQTRDNLRKMVDNTVKQPGTSTEDKAKAAYVQAQLDNNLVAAAKQTAKETLGFAGGIAKTPVDILQGAGKAGVRIVGGLANKDVVDVGKVGGAILGEQKIKSISGYGSDIVKDTGKVFGKDIKNPGLLGDVAGIAATVGDALPGVAGLKGAQAGIKAGIAGGTKKEVAQAVTKSIGVDKLVDSIGRPKKQIQKVTEKLDSGKALTQNEIKVVDDIVNAAQPATPGTISTAATTRMAQGDAAAARKILDNSGVNIPTEAKTAIAEQIGYANSPTQVKGVLDNYGIPTESLAAARKKATPSQVKAADEIIQNKVPTDRLTPDEQAIVDRAYGTPQQKKAIERATTAPADRVPETPAPENPAYRMNNQGQTVPIKNYGKAGENLGKFQADLEKSPLQRKVERGAASYIRPLENRVRKLEEKDPVLGKHVDDLRVANQDAQAATTEAVIKQRSTVDDVTKGLSRKDADDMQYILENYSNKAKVGSVGNEKAKAAADAVRPIFQDLIDQLNPVLKENGMKEIGRIEDYFPRMQQMNKLKGLPEDIKQILGASQDGSGIHNAEGGLSRGFMKSRELDEQAGRPLHPVDAVQRYIRQSNDLIHTLPVYRRAQAMTRAVDESQNLPPAAKKEITSLLSQFKDQFDKALPENGAQRVASKLTNLVSRTQIAGSASTALTAVANPVFGAMNNALKRGFLRGGVDSVAAVVRGIGRLPLAREGKLSEFSKIDGMESSYLKNLIGAKAGRRGNAVKDAGGKVVDAGYAVSNFGDAPYRAGFLETRYNALRAETPGLPKEDALRQAERDTQFVFGNRSRGERSTFTSSNKVIPKLASQYQVEQIANALSFVDGVLLSKNTSFGKKFAAAATGLGAAYGANQLTSAISGGAVKPLPDLVGSVMDAMDKVNREDEKRKSAGEDGLTDEQKVALVMSNTVSNFVSNLPLGRTGLSTASTAAQSAGLPDDVAAVTGLTPRDTNPLQTLPAIGTVADTASAIQKVGQGKDTVANGAITVGSKFVPFGSQARKSIQGIATYVNGGQRAQPTQAQKDRGEPGTQKFTVNNDPTSPEGIVNLAQMVLFGPYAGKAPQDYIKSGFQSQSDRDIANKTYTAGEVGNLTEDQASQYTKSVKTRFKNSLNDQDKALYKFVDNKDEVNRQIANGKLTQDQVDNLKARQNRALYDAGLGYKIDTGYTPDELNQLSDPQKAFVLQKAINTKNQYDEKQESTESKGVVSEAMSDDNRWPTLASSDFKPTNKLAGDYIKLQKDIREAGDDQAAVFEKQKSFWSKAVKESYADKDQSNYKLSIAQIKQAVSSDGITVGNTRVKLGKADLDTMIAMDNKLLEAGLIATPKFSNKTRAGFGYPDAPDSKLDGVGYKDTSKASGSGSGGGSSDKTERTGAADFLTDTSVKAGFKFGGSSSGGKAAPSADFGKLRNTAGVARGSSIKIKL